MIRFKKERKKTEVLLEEKSERKCYRRMDISTQNTSVNLMWLCINDEMEAAAQAIIRGARSIFIKCLVHVFR